MPSELQLLGGGGMQYSGNHSLFAGLLELIASVSGTIFEIGLVSLSNDRGGRN